MSAELSEGDLIALAAADPDEILEQLDKLDSEHKLVDFIKIFWHILEPGRPFVGGWHIDAVSDHLTAVTMGHITRLLINQPPGTMKSMQLGAFWPAWEWGPRNLPSNRFITSSYSMDLTTRDNRRCRNLIISQAYQRKWGDRFQLTGDQNAKTRFDNDRTGFKIATSTGGLGAGERGDRFGCDDPHNTRSAESAAQRNETLLWFTEVVPTRVSDPEKSAIIVTMQRLHEQDVAGEILRRELGYVHLNLPMEFEPERKCFVEVTGFEDPRTEPNELLWPARMTRAVVERDKKVMGEYAAAGQFQQRPAPRGGGMFKSIWWRFFKTDRPLRPIDCDQDAPAIALPAAFDQVLITVDAAFAKTTTGSAVGMLVIGTKGADRFILEDRTRPMSFTETCQEIIKLRIAYPRASRVLVEKKANGDAIIDFLHSKVSGLTPVNPDGGKESRAAMVEPQVRSGNVYLPEGASWVEDFIAEFALFPSTAKNDRVDAVSQALNFLTASVDLSRALMLVGA